MPSDRIIVNWFRQFGAGHTPRKVKCDQLATFPTVLLGPKLGRLNPEAVARLDDALRFGLGL